MTTAVLLTCHGTIDNVDDIPAFLHNIRRGRPTPQHIVDELGYGYIVDAVSSQNQYIGKVISRVHPVIPNTENRFKPQVGVDVDLVGGEAQDATKKWNLQIQVRDGCTDYECKQSDKSVTLTLGVKNW